MSVLHQLFRRLKLRNFLFALMLLSGTVPLAVSSIFLIQQNREIFEIATLESSQMKWNEAYLERQELARFRSLCYAAFSPSFIWTTLLLA